MPLEAFRGTWCAGKFNLLPFPSHYLSFKRKIQKKRCWYPPKYFFNVRLLDFTVDCKGRIILLIILIMLIINLALILSLNTKVWTKIMNLMFKELNCIDIYFKVLYLPNKYQDLKNLHFWTVNNSEVP